MTAKAERPLLGDQRVAAGWAADVRDLAALREVMASIRAHLGRLDIVVAAGVLRLLTALDAMSQWPSAFARPPIPSCWPQPATPARFGAVHPPGLGVPRVGGGTPSRVTVGSGRERCSELGAHALVIGGGRGRPREPPPEVSGVLGGR
jgi:hypothetical protein